MAFPVGWGRRCALVIQSNKVDANQSDFPVLLTKDTLPSEMFDHDGSYPALEGGGDIRFSSDEAGNTQLACEVVSFSLDDANNEAEIWVKIPSAAAGADTTFYIWYNKTGETQPAIDSTYGAENVWDSNFKMVQHMNEDPSGSSPQMIDSTSNDNDGTSYGSMTSGDLVDGKVGKALDFDGSDDYVDVGTGTNLNLSNNYTISLWIKPDDDLDIMESDQGIFDSGMHTNSYDYHSILKMDSTTDHLQYVTWAEESTKSVFCSKSSWNAGQWYNIVIVHDSSNNIKWYIDGVLDDTDSFYALNTTNYNGYRFGIRDTVGINTFFDGKIDETHISNIARSAEWIKASYNNQFSPSTFVIEGTPATPGGVAVAPTSIFYGPLVGPFGGPI